MPFGTTPKSTTVLGDNEFPVSAVAVPDEASGNLTALEGGPESTDSNNNKTAPASIYIKDGNDVTLGISTDANTVNSVMGRLTKIRDLLLATLAVSGNVTEANSAAVKADLDAINAAIGAVSDAAWSGSGNGSEIAILKKIVADLASTLTVSGSVSVSNLPATQAVSGAVTANAGTNLNTSLLALESGGNLASVKADLDTLAGAVAGGKVLTTPPQSNIATDYDTGAGTQSMTMFGIALPASGGAVAGGTSTNPMRTDPTGTTTQPVSGSVSVSNFPSTQPISASSLPLPTGAAQEAGNLANVASNTSNVATVAGATADAAVTGDNSGTLSAKLRGLTKIFTDIWDSVNHRIKVDGSGVTQPVSGTFWQATQPVSGTVTANQGGTWTVQPGNTANSTPWLTLPQAGTSGGSTPNHTMSAATTNATSLKGSAGMIYGLTLSNANAAARYFKLYNKATSPTVGTDTPVLTVQVPANGTVIRVYSVGLALGTGIAWGCTTGIADADTGAVGLNDLSIDIDYK